MDASSVSGPDMPRERSRLDDLRNESIHAATDRTNHQLTGCPSAASRAKANSTWFALRNPVFCRLWFATLLSGTFVSSQDVVATWLMHDLGAAPFLLSLMATAASAPFFLFTLPAGAIADIVNRRTVIVSAVLWQALWWAILAFGAFLGLFIPGAVLACIFALGIGLAFSPEKSRADKKSSEVHGLSR